MATTEAPEKGKAEDKATKSKAEAKEVNYAVFKRVEGTKDEVLAALSGQMSDDDPQSVLVFVSQAIAKQPNGPANAIKALKEHYEIDGDYAVCASKSISVFPGLKSELQRTIAGL